MCLHGNPCEAALSAAGLKEDGCSGAQLRDFNKVFVCVSLSVCPSVFSKCLSKEKDSSLHLRWYTMSQWSVDELEVCT